MSFRKVLRLFSVAIIASVLVIVTYVAFVSSPHQEQIHLIKNSRILQYSLQFSSNDQVRSTKHVSSRDEIFLNWNSKKDSFHSDVGNSELDVRSLIPDFSLTHHQGISDLLQIRKGPSKKEMYSIPHLERNTTPCSDELCTNYLSQDNKLRYQQCGESVLEQNNTSPQEASCHFVKGDGRPPVALVSFPGSGNTWVRQLLEASTEICTGGIYCDVSLRAKGFAGEFIRGSSVLVVKTHEVYPLWLKGGTSASKHVLSGKEGEFGAAIFLVRNPFHALVAEWNRKVANDFSPRTVRLDSHVERAGKEWFGENEKWNLYVHEQSNRWQAMIKNWVILLRSHNPVLVVKYEALQRNPLAELQRMLQFLNTESSQNLENIDIASFSDFHRRNHALRYEYFTFRQRQYVLSSVTTTLKSLKKHNLTSDINIKDYYEY